MCNDAKPVRHVLGRWLIHDKLPLMLATQRGFQHEGEVREGESEHCKLASSWKGNAELPRQVSW